MIGFMLAAVLMDDPAIVVREVLAKLSAQDRTEQGERSLRVVMVTAEWCYVCKQGLKEFRPWMEKSGWTFGDSTAHVELIDADKRPDFVREFKITSLPTFILLKDGVEIRRTGYAGRNTIPALFDSVKGTK